MKRPSTVIPKRPVSTRFAVARDKKEAAIQLVRLEFDISRLKMAIDQADKRSRMHRNELEEKARQRSALLAILND